MTNTSGILWKSEKLIWKSWSDEVVVYNLSSGNTHLVTPIAAEVLQLLELKPLDITDITKRLARSAGVNFEEELTPHVEHLIGRLDDLGLIAPVV